MVGVVSPNYTYEYWKGVKVPIDVKVGDVRYTSALIIPRGNWVSALLITAPRDPRNFEILIKDDGTYESKATIPCNVAKKIIAQLLEGLGMSTSKYADETISKLRDAYNKMRC